MNFSINKVKWVITCLMILTMSVVVFFPAQSRTPGVLPEGIEMLYKTKCASCHGADGSGNTATGKKLKVRDLRSAEVQKMTDAQLQAMIAKGKGKMPGYEKSLGADKVKELTAYVRKMGK